MPDAALSLRDARLTLRGNAGAVEILRGITLSVTLGEAVGLVGPSGSGKSSLLMLMGGLEQATGGEVLALGQDLGRMDEDALARFRRDNMGVVFQSFHLIPTMTALENVAVPLELAGRRDAFRHARARLEEVGLGDRVGHHPGQLSGGEQQRAALARALVGEPRLLLADEPTGNLDQKTGKSIIELLKRLNRESGVTIITATHDDKMLDVSDRIVWVSDGKIERIRRRDEVDIQIGTVAGEF